jgi:hypothetical protein
MSDEQQPPATEQPSMDEMLDQLALFGTSSIFDFARNVIGEWEGLFGDFQREVMPRLTQVYVPFAGGGTGLLEGRDFGDAYYSVHTFRLMDNLNRMVNGLSSLAFSALSIHNAYIGADAAAEATVDTVVTAFHPNPEGQETRDPEGNVVQDGSVNFEAWEDWATESVDSGEDGPGTDFSDLERGGEVTNITIEREDGGTEVVDVVIGDNEDVDSAAPRPYDEAAEGMAGAPSQSEPESFPDVYR